MHRQAISACKYGLPISKHQVLKLADLCALDPVYVMACIEHHRAERLEDTLTLPIWRAVADRFFSAAQQTGPAAKGLAVAMLAALLMLANPVKSMAKPLIFNGHTIHYAKYKLSGLIKQLCDVLHGGAIVGWLLKSAEHCTRALAHAY